MQDEDFIPDRERPASPLRAEDRTLPADIRRHLIQAQSSWLSNTAVVALLKNFQHATWDVRRSPPDKPPGKCLATACYSMKCSQSQPIRDQYPRALRLP